jgi:hypothetical protein
MTTGRMVLIPEDQRKGSISSDYRGITRLSVLYKITTVMISEYVSERLRGYEITPRERKAVE